MTSMIDEVDALIATNIARKLPNMAKYSFNDDETDYLYDLAGQDLLTVSQLRTLVMLMAKKISKTK